MLGECRWRVLFEHWRSCNYVFTQLIQIYVNGKSLRTNVQSALFAVFHCRVAAFNAFPQSSPHSLTHTLPTWLLQIFNELQVQLRRWRLLIADKRATLLHVARCR